MDAVDEDAIGEAGGEPAAPSRAGGSWYYELLVHSMRMREVEDVRASEDSTVDRSDVPGMVAAGLFVLAVFVTIAAFAFLAG